MDIPLTDAVASLRDELVSAAAKTSGSGVVFAVSQVELEFTIELREDSSASGGFRAWVLSADAERSQGKDSTHRVSLTLVPRAAQGGEVLIAGDPHRTAGPGDVSGHLGR